MMDADKVFLGVGMCGVWLALLAMLRVAEQTKGK